MRRLSGIIVVLLLSLTLCIPAALAEQTITAVKTQKQKAPVIDGKEDAVWASAQTFKVRDNRIPADIILKALHTDDMIYFLVKYPDAKADTLHKPWVWDKAANAYNIGKQTEDSFTFKWNMEKREVDLSSFSDDNYTADVWYWKAHRTDPVGYADDKYDVLTNEEGKKAQEITSKTGKKRFLFRKGDEGEASDKKRILTKYQGDIQSQYEIVQPTGSRGDVLAKGIWNAGFWTIEFSRKLKTGHNDDVQFETSPDKKYLFGVSIFGLYGEPIDEKAEHFYGQGRISDKLYLVFR